MAEVIRQHYDLGPEITTEPVPHAHQQRHRKLIVRSRVGKFVAKTYLRDPAVLEVLRFQHLLSERLASHEFPVAKIHPSKEGTDIVEVDNWAMELQEFIEGSSMPVNERTLTTASLALGRFHTVSCDLPRPKRDARIWRFSEVPTGSFAKLYEWAILETEEDSREELEVEGHASKVAMFLEGAADAISPASRRHFPTGIIHGDWHSGNMVFRGEELVGILDLEFAGEGCYLEDLSYGVSNLCVRTSTNPGELADRTNTLLKHYQYYRRISLRELAALYYAVGIKHIATVAYQTGRNEGVMAGCTARDWMGRLACQCDWLANRAAEAEKLADV
jgi:Ser/Thr protein kinase RdoA (MazF antagonist)